MYGYIYKTTNKLNGKIYVGKKRGMFDPTYFGSGKYLRNALKKYGADNFSVGVIEYCVSLNHQNEREKYWIKYFQDLGCEMYNISQGGDGGNTYYGLSAEDRKIRCDKTRKITVFNHLSTESRKKAWDTRRKNGTDKFSATQLEKMSKSHLGKHPSKETIAKRVKSRQGYKHSDETKKKIGDGNRGKKLSIETRQKISVAQVGKRCGENNPFYGKKHSSVTKELIGSHNKERFSNLVWINNGEVNKRIPKESIDKYILLGYELGRIKWGKR